jgi:uncharacterized membrane protein
MNEEQQIDGYLSLLRANLGPITLAERDEILREIGAHIRDSTEESGASVSTVLARLGPPEELAAQYRDGLLVHQASRSLSPLLLLRATLRLSTKGVLGILVFFCGLFGYAMGGGLVLTALLKPILPVNTGLWLQDGHFVSSGVLFPPPASPAHEVLGLWYIPLVLTAGSLILLFTTFAVRTFLRASERWQSRLGMPGRPVQVRYSAN